MFQGLTAHCLSKLCLHLLQEEDLKNLFDDKALLTLWQDLSHLVKAACRMDTAMDVSMPIVKCLEMFLVGTDLPKKPPTPPKQHNIGLLREKCCYNTSVRMTEDMVLPKKEQTGCNVVSNLATVMSPTLHEEYRNLQLSVVALSVVFGCSELNSEQHHIY